MGKLLGLDVGTKNIGIAITDDTRKICMPSELLIRQSNKKDFEVLQTMIKKKKAKGIVVGLPLYFNDEESEITKFVKRFAENLAKVIEIPMVYCNESLTSFEAEEVMRGVGDIKKNVDKISASYILEHFLVRI
ncbi:MAG: Holliday junction resolvase RuvX [Rickettsiales bacterium]|jgi:putative Holliday junction resolvase|nr:Holliday junction resolvase RuvX [Rickettsiales bacterium]